MCPREVDGEGSRVARVIRVLANSGVGSRQGTGNMLRSPRQVRKCLEVALMQQGARWRGSMSSTSAGDAGREESWARPVPQEVPGRRGACPRVEVTVAKDAAGAGPGEAAREMGGGQSRGPQRGRARGSDERPPPGGPGVRLTSSYLPSRSGSWSGRTQNPGRSFSGGMIAGAAAVAG